MPFLDNEELQDLVESDMIQSDLIQSDILNTVESATNYPGGANDLGTGPSVVAIEDQEDSDNDDDVDIEPVVQQTMSSKKRGRPSLSRSETPAKPSVAKTPCSTKTAPTPKSSGRKRKAPEPEPESEPDVEEDADEEPEEEEEEGPAKKRGRPSRAAAVVNSARLARKAADKPTRGRPKSTTTTVKTPAAKPAKGKGGRPKKNSANGDSSPREEYEVEEIVDAAIDSESKEHMYQVKWKGYPASENTWEPKKNLAHALDLVKAFTDKRKKAAAEEAAATKEKKAAAEEAAATKEKKQPKEKKLPKGKAVAKTKEPVVKRTSGRTRATRS